jgi:HSP20 family protein
MNRMFEDFFTQPFGWPAPSQSGQGVPAPMDVEENDGTITVTAELPGVSKEDLDISVHEGMLEIKGEKKKQEERDEDNMHIVERSYGSFRRSVMLPAEVDSDRAEASIDKGVLTLKLPKIGPKAGKKQIKVG